MACDSAGVQGLWLSQDENHQDIMLSQCLLGFGIFSVASSKAMAKAKVFPSIKTKKEKHKSSPSLLQCEGHIM